jgi:hypothetical protein
MATFKKMKTGINKKRFDPPQGVSRRDFLKYASLAGVPFI